MNRIHRWFCKSSVCQRELSNSILPWTLDGVDPGSNILEVGPGPGLTTDLLRQRFDKITAIEIDPELADSLKQRLEGTNVRVIEGDATEIPFQDRSFSGAVSFTMLHHVPSVKLQDRLLREVFRVLEPGGFFAGSDSVWSVAFQLFHLFDTLVPIDPRAFGKRLENVGFSDVRIDVERRKFRFQGRRA